MRVTTWAADGPTVEQHTVAESRCVVAAEDVTTRLMTKGWPVSSPGGSTVLGADRDPDLLLGLVDASLVLMSVVGRTTVHTARAPRRLTSPILRRVERLPVVTTQSRALSASLHRRGAPVRRHLATTGTRLLDVIVPLLLEQLLRRVDLTDVVRRHVDLDRVVAEVDLDAVAARLDVDAVAARLDLAAVVSAALVQIDLTAIVEQAIEAMDLPEIIRESSGALTSDTVRGARIRSAAADQALGRVRDRLLPHRNGARLPIVPSVTPDRSGPELPTAPERS